MDKDTKVKVVSTVYGTVTVQLPNMNFTRVWPNKGAAVMIPFAVLEEGIFDTGFNNMLRDGDLYIEDMEVKRALGLEDPEAEAPTAIIDLTDDYMKKLLTATPLKDFREEVEKLSHEQVKELVQFAVDIGVTDYHRCKLLQEKTGFDVMKAAIARKEEEAENAAE